jgi:hypothetical protein
LVFGDDTVIALVFDDDRCVGVAKVWVVGASVRAEAVDDGCLFFRCSSVHGCPSVNIEFFEQERQPTAECVKDCGLMKAER